MDAKEISAVGASEGELRYDAEGTAALCAQKTVMEFQEWLQANGAMMSKVQCPAVFKIGGAQPTSQSGPDPDEPSPLETAEVQGVRGLLSTQEIKPREVICAVPNKLIISAATARNSELAEVFRNHEELFVA